MAKKKHKKKHSFQHKNVPATVATPVAASSKAAPSAPAPTKALTMPNEWSEVRADVRKTLILGSVFIVLMIGLWLLFENTSVGANLYKSITL